MGSAGADGGSWLVVHDWVDGWVAPRGSFAHRQPQVAFLQGDQTYTEKRGHNFQLNADFDTAFANLDSYDGLYIPGCASSVSLQAFFGGLGCLWNCKRVRDPGLPAGLPSRHHARCTAG